MKTLLLKTLLCFIFVTAAATNCFSQTDTTKSGDYDGLSLKDLLDIKIVSVSKKREFLFDAPMSASVVTREEIQRTGCTSIMEALRLVPGMIVREQSNGNYDIHLRGMDNVPPNAPFDGNSTTTLVMIDNRPIYNYLKGGTFWETLPIDINDVEKIEVVRGPAAALYGPNAVNGVINIITRQTKRDGLYLVANAQQGSFQTFINNASVGFQSKKWSVIASGNYQGRERTQSTYYEFFRDEWRDRTPYSIGILNDTILTFQKEYPSLAMRKYAGNAFFTYNPAEEIKISMSAGAQHSIVERVSTENGVTPLSTVISDSRYAEIRATIKGLSTQFAYLDGTQNPIYPRNKYDFKTIDANIEYNYTKGDLSIKPGLSYRSAVYDDTKYFDPLTSNGVFNARGEITTKTASLRTDYKLLEEKLRMVAAVAVSKFNYPDREYVSYELASTYKINSKQLIRAVWSQAPRAATIYDTYIDQDVVNIQIGYQKYMQLNLEGNKNLKLLMAKMFEIGYRGNLAPGLSVDIELFDIRSKNYNSLVVNGTYVKLSGNDTLLITPVIPTNLPVSLYQQGLTVSLNYQNSKFQVRPFITFQRSSVKNYAPYLNTADANWPVLDNPTENNINSGIGTEAKIRSTPAVFGGAVVNWLAGSKFNINLNTYYYSAQTLYHASNIVFNDGIRGIDHIPAKLIINAKVSYMPRKGVNIFITGKNLLNDKTREFFRTDAVPFMLFGGVNFEL